MQQKGIKTNLNINTVLSVFLNDFIDVAISCWCYLVKFFMIKKCFLSYLKICFEQLKMNNRYKLENVASHIKMGGKFKLTFHKCQNSRFRRLILSFKFVSCYLFQTITSGCKTPSMAPWPRSRRKLNPPIFRRRLNLSWLRDFHDSRRFTQFETQIRSGIANLGCHNETARTKQK